MDLALPLRGLILGFTRWVVLTSLVAFARGRVSPRVLTWVSRLSGAALVTLGIAAVWSAVV